MPKDELIKQLRRDFNTSFSDADRIVRTELSHVQNQAAADGYKSARFDSYEFLAAIDDRTSDECMDLDGQTFLFDEAQVGVNFPPIHVDCRSTIVAAK